MGKIAIIGKQQPRFIREAMVEYIKEQGHDAVLLDMPTRNTADWKEALKKEMIHGAGLDVLRQEPVSPDCPLLGIKSCVLEPHIGANTNDAVMNAGMFAAGNCVDFFEGREVRTILNPAYKDNL